MIPREASTTDASRRWLADRHERLVAFRRDLHAHPEPSGEEHRTTAIVAEMMSEAGYEVRRLRAGTGLIADTAHAVDGPRLAIRADLDALAMQDHKDVAYRSTIDGVAHACGHDVHTTIALGAALFFADHPDILSGPVRFLFQPAEERVPGGALDVIADGGLDGVDTVVGFHCEPKLDRGTIGLRTGAITSAADMVAITVRGPGGHTARPELTVDTVALAARIVTEVPLLLAADVKLVFGAIHAGDAANVIPTHCELRASVRTRSLDTWENLEAAVRGAIASVVDGTDASCDVAYTHGVPPTVNDAAVIDRFRSAATDLGDVDVVEATQSWGGDDFAWLSRRVPGAYVRLGVHDPDSGTPRLDLHAGLFDVDERAIDIGIGLLVAFAAS